VSPATELMANPPLVSVIIPHYNGKEILYTCLRSLAKTTYSNKEVLVVDNGSTDDSLATIEQDFPWVRLLHQATNLGYAGGCNAGLVAGKGAFALFLNNDTKFEGDWLTKLVLAITSDDLIAAVQPKLLALKQPDKFDYSGAAGGLIDYLGFPFARGRLFFTLETDRHQYDRPQDIFWASGTATLVRKSAMDRVGAFDENFFAHMEEIDLNWRFHLHGYRVRAVPDAVVYHDSGSTLPPDSFRKVYLNHKNSLFMLIKNYQLRNLVWIFPSRLFLEFVALVYSICSLDFIRVRAVVLSLLALCGRLVQVLRGRRVVQRSRTCSDAEVFRKMYHHSVVLAYFVRGIRTTEQLLLGPNKP